jgi:hypothetical protein
VCCYGACRAKESRSNARTIIASSNKNGSSSPRKAEGTSVAMEMVTGNEIRRSHTRDHPTTGIAQPPPRGTRCGGDSTVPRDGRDTTGRSITRDRMMTATAQPPPRGNSTMHNDMRSKGVKLRCDPLDTNSEGDEENCYYTSGGYDPGHYGETGSGRKLRKNHTPRRTIPRKIESKCVDYTTGQYDFRCQHTSGGYDPGHYGEGYPADMECGYTQQRRDEERVDKPPPDRDRDTTSLVDPPLDTSFLEESCHYTSGGYDPGYP